MANEERPLEIPAKYETITYLGPRLYPIELIDFVTFPATAKDIRRENCRGYGKRFRMRKSEIKRKAKEGIVKFVIKGTVKPSWEEIKINPRARSAKLKIIEKI